MLFRKLILVFALSVFSVFTTADTVVKDGEVSISEIELREVMKTWTPSMLSSAANDSGDRLELLNQLLTGKKIAREADKLTPTNDGYWELKLALESVKQQFMFRRHMASLEVPDIATLARERYDTRKDKYAKVPETRSSSHILLHCPTGTCDRKPLREKAAELVAQLRDGADFETMAEQYSGDPGSKSKGGRYDRWMRFGDPEVTPPYSEALFKIKEIGDYSDPTDSQFGVHIIRLDGIRKESYRAFDEVREKIATDIYNEYRKLSAKEYQSSFMISDDAFIDGKAIERLLAPYRDSE